MSVTKIFSKGLVGAVLGGFSTSLRSNSKTPPPAKEPESNESYAITVSLLLEQETVPTFDTAEHETVVGTVISEGKSNLNLSPDTISSAVMTWKV